jgi:tetratricopeptide (TPR) repeat protein
MRRLFVCSVSALLLAAAPVAAQEAKPVPAAAEAGVEAESLPPPTRAERIDTLFSELKRESNENAARRIASRIQGEWNRSESAVVDLMMQWSQKAIEKKQFDVALDFLDQVTTLAPGYAEGWNRRATVHFLMSNFRKSMSDIDRTLRLEPRHFGALAGLAQIMKDGGNDALALKAYERVLAVYPMMRDAQNQVATLSDKLAGEGI